MATVFRRPEKHNFNMVKSASLISVHFLNFLIYPDFLKMHIIFYDYWFNYEFF